MTKRIYRTRIVPVVVQRAVWDMLLTSFEVVMAGWLIYYMPKGELRIDSYLDPAK